jgi:predicted nucleic acid-binding protein
LSVFVDTSAVIAVLDRSEADSVRVRDAWVAGFDDGEGFITSNYVVVEASAVAQRRLGMDAVRDLVDEILPLIHVEWVTGPDHAAGVAAMLAANRRQLSLVDCVSFAMMRRLGIRECLAVDPHFAEQGFTQYSPRTEAGTD